MHPTQPSIWRCELLVSGIGILICPDGWIFSGMTPIINAGFVDKNVGPPSPSSRFGLTGCWDVLGDESTSNYQTWMDNWPNGLVIIFWWPHSEMFKGDFAPESTQKLSVSVTLGEVSVQAGWMTRSALIAAMTRCPWRTPSSTWRRIS